MFQDQCLLSDRFTVPNMPGQVFRESQKGRKLGKRGPSPKPTNIRLLHGDKKNRINRNEPKPSEGEVVCPEWLSPEAQETWNRLAPELTAQKVLTSWDVDAFAVYCDAVAQFQKAVAQANKAVLVQSDSPGRQKKNPALQVVRDTAQTIRAYAQEFGLTPSARSSLSRPAANNGQGVERFFSGLSGDDFS